MLFYIYVIIYTYYKPVIIKICL